MKCIDKCGAGVPAPLWKRCERCAMIHLHRLMSDGRKQCSKPPRTYGRGDRVFVNGEVQQPGEVVRVRDHQYTVKLDRGGRCYVTVEQLRDERASSAPAP